MRVTSFRGGPRTWEAIDVLSNARVTFQVWALVATSRGLANEHPPVVADAPIELTCIRSASIWISNGVGGAAPSSQTTKDVVVVLLSTLVFSPPRCVDVRSWLAFLSSSKFELLRPRLSPATSSVSAPTTAASSVQRCLARGFFLERVMRVFLVPYRSDNGPRGPAW